MSNPLKILLLGDYSHCHSSLAEGLRRLGHDVTLGSNGTYWMQTPRDFSLARGNGKISGAWLYFRTLYPLHHLLKGYDIVAVNDPVFVELKPKRLKPLFDRLKRENGSVFYTAMSTDIFFLNMLEAPDSPIRYSEWFVEGEKSRWHEEHVQRWLEWHKEQLVDYEKHFFENIDGAVAVLYEYYEGLKYALPESKIAYGGIPIHISDQDFSYFDESSDRKIKIFLGRDKNRIKMKGSDYLEQAANKIVKEFPDLVEFDLVENVAYNDFLDHLKKADIVLDQIYSYSPSTTPLLAMSFGKTVLSGGEEKFYNFIGETTNRPIINASLTVDELTLQLRKLIHNRKFLAENSRRSREFVMKHNDSVVVAQRFLDFWQSRL